MIPHRPRSDFHESGQFLSALFRRANCLFGSALLSALPVVVAQSDLEIFQKEIQPVLDEYCYDCHGNGNKKGGVQLDGFENEAALHDQKLWLRALKNVRSGIMPPADEPHAVAGRSEKLPPVL